VGNGTHSEGIAYKPNGEVAMCLRVGQMGPNKRKWTETIELGPERGPLGQRAVPSNSGTRQQQAKPGDETGNAPNGAIHGVCSNAGAKGGCKLRDATAERHGEGAV
jgi:hypothetical protein